MHIAIQSMTPPPANDAAPANNTASSWWLDPTPKSAKWRYHNWRETSETTHLTHLSKPISTHLTFSLQWHPRPVQRLPPSNPLSPPSPPLASSSSVTPFFHPKKECPLWLSESLLLHLFRLLIQAGIEPHPGPVQDPCSVCGNWVHPGWVAILYMVCDQWCHRCCSGIHSPEDYWRLAPCAPPQSHLQHPTGSQSPLTWNELVQPSRPGTPSTAGPIPSDPVAPQPRRAVLSQRGRFL